MPEPEPQCQGHNGDEDDPPNDLKFVTEVYFLGG